MVWAIVALGCGGAPAFADDAPAPDKSQFTLLNPTPDASLRDFSPDRPTKITGPFTVDAGHLQIESDLANYSRTDFNGMSTSLIQALDPTIKLGVLNNVDLEVAFNGLDDVRVRGGGQSMHLTGFGDVYFRAKINLIGNDGGDFAFAVLPYVKIPSATPAALAIGNDVVEGGGLAVTQLKLPQDFTLQFQNEIDALKGGNDSLRHANVVDILTLSHEVPGIKNLTASAEIFTSVSTDRFTSDLYTADVALSYIIKPATQFDIGANFGINRAAPGIQVYAGVAQRF